jgi:hypothetical protein
MTNAKSTCATGIPLYLIPQAITRLIRARGEKVYRISVVRTHYHHYNISVRTRLVPRELRAREQFPAPDYPPVRSDDDCEGGIA